MRLVMWISAAMMVVEIATGWWSNSMALLADGWHMSSHVVAIGLSAFAYAAARRYAHDPRFAFGTWKIEVLAGFASAIVLAGVAAWMVLGSIEHLIHHESIDYVEAIVIATVGLGVNVACALILGPASHRAIDGDEPAEAHHHHAGHGHDLNLKSAYLHVLADAVTSILAIGALLGGWMMGWWWLDPLAGLVGAGLVGVWAIGLMRATGKVLLDREMDHPLVEEIQRTVNSLSFPAEARIADMHVWRVGRGSYSCVLTLITHDRRLTATQVRRHLARHARISHCTVEIHWCDCGGSFADADEPKPDIEPSRHFPDRSEPECKAPM